MPFICGALLACEGGGIDPSAVSRAVQVNAVIENVRTTGTASNMWRTGDAIGLFMVRSGEGLSETALAQNIQYVTSGGTSFLPGNETERILFPFNASNVDFIGYYPFTTEINGVFYPVDVTDQSNQAAIELLYSNNARGLNSKSPFANLTFSHQLTKIILNIRPEDTFTDLSGLSVQLANTGTNARFSLTDGTLSPPTLYGNISFKTTPNGRFAEAIILPTTDVTGKHLVFEVNETTYLFDVSSSLNINSFDKATRYVYNVTLNPQGTGVITDSSISDWIDGPTESITLYPNEGDVPDFTKGRKNNPFTVEEARLNSGRTDVWVIGYIVGFYPTSTFRSFVNDAVGVEGALASQSNLALAFGSNETVAENTFPIQLPSSGRIRNELNLRANPDNFKRKVLVRGDIATYLNTIGLRNLTDFEFVGE